MLVTDLHHLLDLPEDTPGPARRLAHHLGNIVRAATAGEGGTAWHSAVPCRRRPAHRPCPGRVIVLRPEPAASIRWQCSSCDDEGIVSNWEDSPFDLRTQQLTLAGAIQVVVAAEVAAALRELRLLDIGCQRLVFRGRAHGDDVILSGADEDIDELIGFVAAESNHEPNRRRRQRLDAAFGALSDAHARNGG